MLLALPAALVEAAAASPGASGTNSRLIAFGSGDATLIVGGVASFALLLALGVLVLSRRSRRGTSRRRAITSEAVAAAVQLDEFGVHFQPILALATGELIGAEALVRWEQPGGAEAATARQFFSRAASAGVLDDVVAKAMRPACDFARDCLDASPGTFQLHINLSQSQLEAGEATIEVLQRALRESQLVPWAIQVEVPEQALLEIGPGVTATLQAFSALGVNIAIDDFWGQDETYWVLGIPGVSAVKLDLRSNTSNEATRANLANAARIAHTRGLTVAAKRVESSFEMEFAAEIGCSQVQGHAYGRPMPAQEFRRYAADLQAAAERLAS
jgi:EAL domain-containing protein (putative c-di-GMP-specific phosphodiesterase class I)